jgi:hypothetical protein
MPGTRAQSGIIRALAALLAFLAASAVLADDALVQENPALATSEAGYGRVFGRIVMVEDGREREISAMLDVVRVRIRAAATDQTQALRVTGDGRFEWALKPGEYILQSFYYRQSLFRIWNAFTVPEPGRAAYLGNLRVIVDGRRMALEFVDAWDDEAKVREARFRDMGVEPEKALLRREAPVGSYARVASICAKGWGIECTRNFQGVEPVRPEGAYQGYPRQETRTPFFEWKPSQAEGIAYDFAIYEAFDPGLFEGRTERGRLVFYKEGLAEPRFQLEEPLPAGRRYMWSVRLRKGDLVSTWTSTSYFAFLLVAWTSGSGQWFGFEIPDR